MTLYWRNVYGFENARWQSRPLCLSLFSTHMVGDILLAILLTCAFQFKCWSIIIPRRLKLSTYSISVTANYSRSMMSWQRMSYLVNMYNTGGQIMRNTDPISKGQILWRWMASLILMTYKWTCLGTIIKQKSQTCFARLSEESSSIEKLFWQRFQIAAIFRAKRHHVFA